MFRRSTPIQLLQIRIVCPPGIVALRRARLVARREPGTIHAHQMTASPPKPSARDPVRWLSNQPYLLLSLTSLFWAANIVLARHVGDHVPPITLTTIRWFGVFLILLPFAWPHLEARLADIARQPAAPDLPVADRLCLQQRDFLLGAAIHRGAERAADPVVGTAVRGDVVAGAVRGAADAGAVFRHRHIARRCLDHHPARRFCGARAASPSTRAT